MSAKIDRHKTGFYPRFIRKYARLWIKNKISESESNLGSSVKKLFRLDVIDVQTVLSWSSTLICEILSKTIEIWRGDLCAHVVKTVISIKPFMAHSRFSQKEFNYEYFLHLSGPVFVYLCLSLTYWIPLGNKKTGIILFGECVIGTLKAHLNLIYVMSHLYVRNKISTPHFKANTSAQKKGNQSYGVS